MHNIYNDVFTGRDNNDAYQSNDGVALISRKCDANSADITLNWKTGLL